MLKLLQVNKLPHKINFDKNVQKKIFLELKLFEENIAKRIKCLFSSIWIETQESNDFLFISDVVFQHPLEDDVHSC